MERRWLGRIAGELTKLLRAERPGGPSAGIELLTDTGVADLVLPEVPGLRLEADEHHRHKDVYRHSLTVLDQAESLAEGFMAESRTIAPLIGSPNQVEAIMAYFEKRQPEFGD